MRAVVLVGGFGTRLRPLTLTRPKQMLPIGQQTMLEVVVRQLGSHGVTEAILSLGYKPDAFADAYPDSRIGDVRLTYAVEPEPLDTAGAIAFAAAEAGVDDTFIAVNGDVLTDLDIGAQVATHRAKGAEGTISLAPVEDPSRFGVVVTADDGRVLDFVEKPPPGEAPSNWISAGTYVFEPSVLGRVEAGRRVSIEREIFPAMVADGTLYAVQSDTYWLDAGTPEAYLQAHLDLADGKRQHNANLVAADATIASDATVTRSAIGSGATVAAGARVIDSVVLPGATICEGAVIERSIVGAGATIGAGSEMHELSVVGDGITLAANTALYTARVPAPE